MLPPDEQLVADYVLADILPHLKEDEYCVVGSLAMRYQLASKGHEPVERPFYDIDMATASPASVLPSMYDTLALTHFHEPGADGRHYLAGIHRETGVPVDLFTWLRNVSSEVDHAPWQGTTIPVTKPEEDFVAKVWEIDFCLARGVKQGWFDDAVRLAKIVDLDTAEAMWRRRCPDRAETLLGTFATAVQVSYDHPDLVIPSGPISAKPIPKRVGCDGCAPGAHLAKPHEVAALQALRSTVV